MMRRRIRSRALGVLCVVALLVLTGQHAQGQCRYEVTAVVEGPNCGVLGPASVHFLGINEHGQACGRRSICNQVGQWLPIVWTQEQGLITLSLPVGATQGVANDINNVIGSDGFGQVACTLSFSGQGSRASLYDDGVWTVLQPEGNGVHSAANAINDDGWVTGYRDTTAGRMVMRWLGDEIEEVANPTGGEAIANDINASLTVTGYFGSANTHAFVWPDQYGATDLGTLLGGMAARGAGIDSNDRITGSASLPIQRGQSFGDSRAFLWENGSVINLGVLPELRHSLAEGISDATQVVGNCYGEFLSPEVPFLWRNGMLTRLEDLFEGVNISKVTAINNRGQIAGHTGGSAEGIILTPMTPLGDVNIDCQVNADDLAIVLSDWGPNKLGHIADIVTSSTFQPPGDGVVDGADLAVVLGNWTDAGTESAASRRR